jgi:hypothetical protein
MSQIQPLPYNYPAYTTDNLDRLSQDVAQHVRTVASRVNQNTRFLAQMAGPYCVGPTQPASMKLSIDPASFVASGAVVTYAGGLTPTFTAPVTHPRIDLIEFSKTTGAITVKAGTEASSPVPPTIDSGNMPIAYISLSVGITVLSWPNIQDVRSPWSF